MAYRTKTYIAGDWTGDENLIRALYIWNESDRWALSFVDAHEMTQARDTSLPCSIKRSLWERLEASKTFVLIVGEKTDTLTKGGCQLCNNYSSYFKHCTHGMNVDYRSYIQYECEKANRDGIRIVVLYNSTVVDRSKCPEVLRYKGEHTAAVYRDSNGLHWNYPAIKKAIMGY